MPLHVELVSPEEVLFTGDADLVIARTKDGEIGFQAGHIPFVGTLSPGTVRVNLSGGGTQVIAVHSGFVEVADNHLTVLSDLAALAENIDIEAARGALSQAEEALRADAADEDALDAKRWAEVQLRAAGAI
jgi:F-type H+-transporting ATPase subunit epsilon